LKYGCLGCLGLVGLVLVVVLVMSGVAYLTARPEQVEDRVLTPEIPSAIAAEGSAAGRLGLTIQEAELHIEPVDSGEPLRIEGRYDVNAFVLEGESAPGVDSDTAWIYRATFGRAERSGAFSGLVSVVRGSTARIDVFLPADVHLDLILNVQEGGAVVRLGGLWLRTADIEFESAALDLDVGEPLREPMKSLSIRTKKGGALLNHLGNASPRLLDVNYSMGHIDMDLGGQWLADAEITIDGGTGGGVVHLPSGVILEGLERRGVEGIGAHETNLPTLRFSVSTGMGWLEFSNLVNRTSLPAPTCRAACSRRPDRQGYPASTR
jgi:hypothetical protein